MKQPLGVDFKYRVSIMTNKYELINTFNQLIQEKFKSITAYIRPKGHYMSMNLENVSDESVYNIDDRQFYSQSCEILVKAYLIPEDYFIVEEKPALKLLGYDMEEHKQTYADIEELPNPCPENDYYYKPLKVTISLAPCDEKIKFTMDCNFTLEKVETDNVISFIFKVNDEIIDLNSIDFDGGETFLIKEGDEVKIKRLKKYNSIKCAFIYLNGLERDFVYNKNEGEISDEMEVSHEGTECN